MKTTVRLQQRVVSLVSSPLAHCVITVCIRQGTALELGDNATNKDNDCRPSFVPRNRFVARSPSQHSFRHFVDTLFF